MLIFTEMNSVQIKEVLQEDCLKQAFEEVDSDEMDVDDLDLDAEMRDWIKKYKGQEANTGLEM